MSRFLEVNNLHVYYDNIHAVKGISFYIDKGEIITIIGANSAGKTTTMRAICGLLGPIRQGEVLLEGKKIHNTPAHNMVKKGIAQVLEGRMLFPQLSVKDNLYLGAYERNWRDLSESLEYVYTLFPRIKERLAQNAGTLSGGEQQMLAIGRALMSKPAILFMDEPSLGLAPIVVEAIFDAIQQINKDGMTMLLVEQNSNIALNVADRAYVLETGEIVVSGPAKQLREDDAVIKSYLGG